MASEVEIQKSLVTQAPQDASGILKKEKEAKNDLVVEEGSNEDTVGECFLYPPSVGKVATEVHLESGLAEQEEIAISDSNTNNQQTDSKNAESGESEAETDHVKKGNEETNASVSNHNNLLEVQAVEVSICVPSQPLETFDKDKKSESNAEMPVPLDSMTFLGKVEAPIIEGEYSLVVGSEEMEQSEKKLIGGDEEYSVDGASVGSQTAFSSVESDKELTSQDAKEVMEAIQPPESTNVEEKLGLQQVGEDIRSKEESSHLYEEISQEKTATNKELKDELTKRNDDQDMGSDESPNGETQILSSQIDTEVTSEESLQENSYELISNDQESLQTEEQHLELVPESSEKEISSELIKAEECVEKQAIKQTETEKKCEEETVTIISEDISAVEITKETAGTEEGETELFVADSEIQEKEVDNSNTSGVPEDNTLETDAKEMNSIENIAENKNEFCPGHNEVVDSSENKAESQEKQETEDPFEEETHNSNASKEVKTTQPAVLEGSLLEAATSKDLYSATSVLGEKSEGILMSGEEKRLEDDNDESRNLPMEKEQDESGFAEEENTHDDSKNIMSDPNAQELVGGHLDEKSEGKFEDTNQQGTTDVCVSEVRLDAAEDNMEGERSVEETANPERPTSPLEGPPLEKSEEVVSVQAAEGIDEYCTPVKTTESDIKTPEKIDDKLEQQPFTINPEALAFDMKDQADHEVHNSGESLEQTIVNRADRAVDLTRQREDDEPRDLDKASSNFDEVTNEENDNETPNTTKEEITDSSSKEESVVKEITEEASDRHNTIQETTEKIYEAKEISNIQKKNSEKDNASSNQITGAEKEIMETTYTARIVVEEKDRDGAENGTTSTGPEEKESTFQKNGYYAESSMQPDFTMENGTQQSTEKIEVEQTDHDHTISTAQEEEKGENGNDLGEVNEGVSKGEETLSREGVSHSSVHTMSIIQASETSRECSEAVELKDESSSNVSLGQKETASSNEEDDVTVTGDTGKVYNLDEIIDKDIVTAAEYTPVESVDKHTEDEKCNMVQETDEKTEDVPKENPTDNIPQDFWQVSPTDLDTLTTEGRTNIDENNPSTESHIKDSQLQRDDQPTSTDNFSHTASGGTEKERTNQEDHLNESTLEVDIEDNISASCNVKGQGCPPVGTDKPEAVKDDDIINERSGDADSEGEQKQATSINVEAIGAAIDAEDNISKQDDVTTISNDGLQMLKGKGESSDGDIDYQESDSPISDEVCTKENTEPADAVEKSESCSDSATASKSSSSVEPNKLGTDESQAVEHEDDEPVMNNHLEEHVSITESETEVEVKGTAKKEEVGQKVTEVDLEETQVIEREVEEDVPHITATKGDDKDTFETVKEDSCQHCDVHNTAESDKNELPKDGQEKEQVGFDDNHGTNVAEDAEIGTYRSGENSNGKEMKETVEKSIHQAESFSTFNDSLQVFEVQDEANKELENIKEENINNTMDVVSAKEISESVVTIDKNAHQTNLEADNNTPSVEANECASDEAIRVMKYQDADPSEYLSQEVHKEQGLSVTEVVTEIKDDESANDKGNENKTASAIELDEETPSITKVTEENFQQVIIEESVDKEYNESTTAEGENLDQNNDDHTKISNVEGETSSIDAENLVPINDEYTEASNVEEESTLAQKHDNPDDRVDNAVSHAISEEEIIDAVEVEKLECGPECNNLTDSNKDETDANCAENVVMDECGEANTLSEEVPELNFAKCSLEKVDDETQLSDELEADEKSQVSEGHSKEEDFRQATEEERTEIEQENERQTCMSDNKNIHEGEKMSELHKSNEMGEPHSGTDENIAEESLVPNESSIEIQNQQTSRESLSSLDFPASNLDIPEEGIKEDEKRVDYGETADNNEIVKADADNDSSVGYRATVNAETSKESEYCDILKEVTGKEEMPTADSGEEVKKTETSSKDDNFSETAEECTPLEVRHSSEDDRDFEVDVIDDKTEVGQQGIHGDDITNKMETVTEDKKNNISEEPGVSNEVATHEGCSTLETTQLSEVTQSSEDIMASKLEISLPGITKEKLGDVSSEATLDTASDMKDDLSDELGASTGDKMSEECVPIDENQSPIDVSDFKSEDQKVDAEEGMQEENCGGTGRETETATTEVKETSPNLGSSVTEKVSKGCEPLQESPLPENTLKEGIEEQKQGEINDEIACKSEITKVEFEDDLPEETSAKTEELSHLEESQSPKDVPVSTFNTPTQVKDNLAKESSGSVPPNVFTGCLDSEECPSSNDASASKFDILNEGIAYGQKQEEISNETTYKIETVNAETKDDLPDEPGTSVEKMTREATEEQKGVIFDETESKTKSVNVEIKVDVPEEPDSLSIEKASEGMPSQEHQSPNNVLDSDLDVPKEGDQEVKENDEAETVQAQVNNDLLKEGASDVEVKVNLPGEPDSLSAAKTYEEGAPLGKDESNSLESSGFVLPEEGDRQKGDDSHVSARGMETVHPQVNSDFLKKSGASDVAIKVVLPEERDSLSEVKISEESVPSGQSQSSEHVLTSTFDIPREGETEKKGDDSNDVSCGVAPLHAQVTDNLLKEPVESNDAGADAAKMSEECAPSEENQSSKNVLDSEFDVPEDDTKEVEKQGEVCSEIAYETNIVDVGNKDGLSEETCMIANEETNSQEGQPEGKTKKVLDVDTMKADETVKENTSEEQLEQSSSWKIEHKQEDKDMEEKEERPAHSYIEKQIADETERDVDDSNLDSELSMDVKQVQALEIPEITDKSSMGEPGESPSEFEGGNQSSNNSESIIKSFTQEITTETELQFSSKPEEADNATPQTDATSENQEQNESSEQKSGLYDQELTKSEENMGEKQCKEEINELIAKENQSEIEREKDEATTCDTNNKKNNEPDGTLEKQNNSSEALDSSEKNTALSDANWEEIAETSAEDKATDTTQTVKELESNDEFPGGEPTQEDFEQATREITGSKVNAVDTKDDGPGLPSKTIPSKLDEAGVQKDINEHDETGCNEIDKPSSVKDKEIINPGSDDGSNIDKPNQEAGRGVEATELHLDVDKNIQNHDDSVEISNDTVEEVQVQEGEGKGAEYHVNNVSGEEVKSVGEPYEAETFDSEEKCASQEDHDGSDVKTPEEWVPQQEGDSEDIITQEVDVSIEKLQEKQQILEKEEPCEQENIQKAINICSTAENDEEITAPDNITREIDVSSAANDEVLHHPKVEENENADHSAQNLMVDGMHGEDKSPKLTPGVSSQEPEELSAADIIANQISLDIEREEQQQQLSSEQLQERKATIVGSSTLDMDDHAMKVNIVAMNFDETTRVSCLPKDGQTEVGVSDSECGLEQTDLEENQKTMSSELVVEPENTMTTGADKATTCDAEKHEDMSQASSREETKAQSQREDRQNIEKSPEDDENQHVLAKANEIPEEKVLCHDNAEAAPQDSQNESPDSSENAATAGEQAKDKEVDLSSVISQMDVEAMKICIIPHMPNVQEQPLEEKEVTIESSDNSENAVTAGEHDISAKVDLSSVPSQKDEEVAENCNIPHMSKSQEQPLEKKEITIESPCNTENVVAAGEQDKGAEVDLSSIASQKDEEAMKICIIPHIPEVQEQMPNEKGVRMEDNKDKDVHETRQMEDTKNDRDDTVRSTPTVEEEKLLENHGSTHEKGQMVVDTSISVSADQDQIGSYPTESQGDEVVSRVPQNAVKETIPMAGAEKSSTGNDKIDEKGCLVQKGEQTNEIKTGSIQADSTKTSSSDIMHRSDVQSCQTDEEKHIIPKEKTPDKEDAAAEELQTDEEDDPDKAPFITESMRDFDIKASNKKSHNILSGVGSKVKHSISKVKKAITCSSSQFASDDVIVKLNKNKKS